MSRIAALAATAVILVACSGTDAPVRSDASTVEVEDADGADSESPDSDAAGSDESADDESADDESARDEPAGDEPADEPGADAGNSDAGQDGGAASGDLDWEPCADDEGLDCATLTVPLDHDDPGGVTIPIAVIRQPATGGDAERIGSVVFNPGGPGGSGVEFLSFARFLTPPALSRRFDLVSFDPRGVGESAAVDCNLDLDDDVVLIPDDDRAAWDDLLEAAFDDLSGCTADVDGLAQLVGTNNAARDLDVLRAALGDDQLTYVGFSYGTRLGATYAELFPDRVRAMVLDGAVVPTTDREIVADAQLDGFELALGNFAAACRADPDCLIAELGPPLKVIAGLRAEIAKVGSFATDDPDRVLTAGEFDLAVLSALYSVDSWEYLDQGVFLAADDADGSLLQALADSYLGRERDGSYANLSEANFFITCADDPDRPSADDVFASADALADRSIMFGDSWRSTTGCLAAEAAVDPLVVGPAAGAPPILVIGTTGDPATPYEWAVELADALDSGVLYTVDGDGHTAYLGVDCVNPVVHDYLIDLNVPAPGGSCTAEQDDPFVGPGENEAEMVVDFVACLVEIDVDIEPITVADVLADPLGEELFGDLDLQDPALAPSLIACIDRLPT